MKILILKTGSYSLEYCYYASEKETSLFEGRLDNYRYSASDKIALQEVLWDILKLCIDQSNGKGPDAVAIYSKFGGEAFPQPAIADKDSLLKMKSLIPRAPMQIPGALALVECCQRLMAETPIVLVFGTSFFVPLPRRETMYGLDPKSSDAQGIRRYGFHSLFHEAAAQSFNKDKETSQKIISICMGAQPEIAAIMGRSPVMVTSGITPLEGLPGHTTCGEIDPSISLILAKKFGWGPEKIDELLTRESGLFGLCGERMTFDEVFLSNDEKHRAAREIFQYRLMLSCGSALAAMGGLDAIVFSGRYLAAGKFLADWLIAQPFFHSLKKERPYEVLFFTKSLENLIAQKAAVTVLQQNNAEYNKEVS
ncbi:MAG TPA: hypothetical protein PKW18_03580 [Candidatus Sumerlaeota bacterium]|nr:MAG: Acetate kinase [candidate division BRC1 bacterium ADurb.Bin183]HOE63561.1 hypothetical protein [Candidatus Sumerlaeota bacterium]HRR31360.1 hypothetical protein [Candidatus Sumerlaeia bacterium]HON50456.1 hypothetical protein [Candidatus Sumerlaeota bacterium]HOR63672.1 hypothetical protein [Candidatus Sumerlaeota bacterium]